MTNQFKEQDGRLIVALDGEVDLSRAPETRRLLLDCVARGQEILVDLSGVTYIDSSGIASLVEALQEAGKKGIGLGLVAVIAVSDDARKVFELARLDKVFTIHSDLDTALANSKGLAG
jgi:anti-sigma B factor antagonist